METGKAVGGSTVLLHTKEGASMKGEKYQMREKGVLVIQLSLKLSNGSPNRATVFASKEKCPSGEKVPDLVLGILVSTRYKEELHDSISAVFRGPHERCVVILRAQNIKK